MNLITKSPIGQMKIKTKVYCEICGCSRTRNLKELVYDNTDEEIKRAKEALSNKTKLKYTCNICKSILKDVGTN